MQSFMQGWEGCLYQGLGLRAPPKEVSQAQNLDALSGLAREQVDLVCAHSSEDRKVPQSQLSARCELFFGPFYGHIAHF